MESKIKYCCTILIIALFAAIIGKLLVAYVNAFTTRMRDSADIADENFNEREVRNSVPEEQQSERTYGDLHEKIKKIVDQAEGTYGVAFTDCNTGISFEINGDKPFTAASCYKLPLNLYLYYLISEGAINPDEKVAYIEDDYETGAGKIIFDEIGTEYTIGELSELSVIESDNIATNMLMRRLRRNNIINFMESIGAKALPRKSNVSSPNDMNMYMQKLLEMSADNPNVYNKLIFYLKNTKFNDRISSVIPKGIEVAHKIGTLTGVLNDTAIVFHSRNPYILTIMSYNVNSSYGSEAYDTIKRISIEIFNHQESKTN